MKTAILTCISLLATSLSFCQSTPFVSLPAAEPIPSFRIGICTGKTTNLVFLYDIISVDRGNQNLLVQKVKAAENILQVKAASGNFAETNLSVVTADKKLHSFLIVYDSIPAILNYRFLKEAIDTNYVQIDTMLPVKTDLTAAEIKDYSVMVSNFKATGTNIKNRKFGMSVRLKGLYIKANVFFFSLQLQNKTPVRYDIESLNMLIKDQRQSKRTATQEIQIHPLFKYGNDTWVESQSKQKLIIAVPKFTIPDRKNFIIQLREANGGRHLGFRVFNKQLLKAKTL